MAARLKSVRQSKSKPLNKKADLDPLAIVAELCAADGKALYASRPEFSRGRLHKEPASKTRSDFHRDRDRIIHSASFRRLKYKTQVFVYHEGDYFRTRLSHSIEVAQVARSLARLLRVDEDLAETCALAHDIGHTPFAHVGEDALKECMEPYGGFDHNDQTLRVVTLLEKRYPDFDGLNLTWETIEGLVKHSGPVVTKGKKIKLPLTVRSLQKQVDFQLSSYASLEAQIAGIADDIAYNSHDIDDGVNSGVINLKDLEQIDWLGGILFEKRQDYPDIAEDRLIPELVREVMGRYILDVQAEAAKRLADLRPKNSDDVRSAPYPIIALSDPMKRADQELRVFLKDRFYNCSRVSRLRVKVFKVVQDLFNVMMDKPRCLPDDLYRLSLQPEKGWTQKNWQARLITDYIASMTDRRALQLHQEIFDAYQQVNR